MNGVLGDLLQEAGRAILNSLWQGSIVGLLAIVISSTVHDAAKKHLVCFLGSVLIAFLFLSSLFSGLRTISWSPSTSIEFSAAAPELSGSVPEPRSLIRSSNEYAPETGPVAAGEELAFSLPGLVAESGPSWIAAIWIGGVTILAARHLLGCMFLLRLRSRGTKPLPPQLSHLSQQVHRSLNLSRTVPVLVSNRVLIPILAGIFRPAVLLPISIVNGIPPAEVSTIIAHELAHFRRRDNWTNTAQVLVETLLFFHPLVWWLGRRVRRERELASDDLVMRSGAEKAVFARALASVAQIQASASRPGLSPAILSASGGSLLHRITRVLHPGSPPTVRLSGGGFAGLAALLLLVSALVVCHSSHVFAQTPETLSVSPGASIQQAIDEAGDGAIIQLQEGHYQELLTISRPVILRGAGWDKTRISPPPAVDDGHPAPIQIRDTKGVKLEGIRVSPRENPDANGLIPPHMTISMVNAEVSISDCGIIGPGSHGLVLQDGSSLTMKDSLVAAFQGTGISVSGEGKENKGISPSRINLTNSVVRSCHHRGITLGSGCDDSLIRGNWISGSAWHGIRYDNASPRIERNIIFENARSGIYASGNTSARVIRNVFLYNEMNGISCWFANGDTIEGNIFVENSREAVAVLGKSKPTLRSNWFLDQDVAIFCGSISQQGDEIGSPLIENNLFVTVETPLRVAGEARELPTGNQNPANTTQEEWTQRLADFGPAEDAEELVGYILPGGPANLIGASPWQTPLPEEKRYLDSTESKAPSPATTPSDDVDAIEPTPQERGHIRDDSERWVRDAFQLDDTRVRDAAIRSIRDSIASGNPTEVRTGLVAFNQLEPIRFDKASFHDLILPLVESPEAFLRTHAVRALGITGLKAGDLDTLIGMIDDPSAEVRETVAAQIIRGTEKDLTGKAGGAILTLLSDEDVRFRKSILNYLWGTRYSTELEKRVIELSHQPADSYSALYYALSTQANKSTRSVKRLIEFLPHQDTTNVAHRAAWGLGQGVTEKSDHSLIADAALTLIEGREGILHRDGLSLLEKYAGPDQEPSIRNLLAKPGVGGEFREKLESILNRSGE